MGIQKSFKVGDLVRLVKFRNTYDEELYEIPDVVDIMFMDKSLNIIDISDKKSGFEYEIGFLANGNTLYVNGDQLIPAEITKQDIYKALVEIEDV
jgi:hypothetical protein